MKQYFTKGISVEGEIKTGDRLRVYNLGNNVVQVTKIQDNTIYHSNGYFAKDHGLIIYQKVKLFLCSRSIQAGDKFRHYHIDPKKSAELRKPVHDFNNLAKEEDICDKVEGGQVWWSRDSQYLPNRANYATSIEGTFKVIGEISPEAVWVKEGMEFDEEELVWQARNSEGDIEDLEDWCDKKILQDDYGYYTIGIKCPCCKDFK